LAVVVVVVPVPVVDIVAVVRVVAVGRVAKETKKGRNASIQRAWGESETLSWMTLGLQCCQSTRIGLF
jgi:hypothetical protein